MKQLRAGGGFVHLNTYSQFKVKKTKGNRKGISILFSLGNLMIHKAELSDAKQEIQHVKSMNRKTGH